MANKRPAGDRSGRWLALAALCLMPLAYGGSTPALFNCGNEGSGNTPISGGVINANSCTDFMYSSTNGVNNWQYGYYSIGSANPSTYMPTASSFQQMTNYQAGFWAENINRYWTSADAFQAMMNSYNTDTHPYNACDPSLHNCGNGGFDPANSPTNHVEQWQVRQFDIPTTFGSGDVNIGMDAQKVTNFGVETQIYVFLIDAQGNTTKLGDMTVQPNGQLASPLNLSNVLVSGGDQIDFALAPVKSTCQQFTYTGGVACGPNNVSPYNTADYSGNTYELFTINSAVPEPGTLLLLALGLAAAGAFGNRRMCGARR